MIVRDSQAVTITGLETAWLSGVSQGGAILTVKPTIFRSIADSAAADPEMSELLARR
jgi:hypothetical protein